MKSAGVEARTPLRISRRKRIRLSQLTAPAVGALVGKRRRELLEQVALRAMHFDAVQSGLRHVLAGHHRVLDEIFDLLARHGARHAARARARNRRGPDQARGDRRAVVLTSAVIDLSDQQRAGRVHGLRPARQAGDDLRIEAGNIAAAHHRRRMKAHRFGDDDAGTAASERRVMRQQSFGDVEFLGEIGRRRSAEDAVARLPPAKLKRREQMREWLVTA